MSFGVLGKWVKMMIEVEGEFTYAAAGVVGVDRRSGEFCVMMVVCEFLDEFV